jgi:NAD(P)-dependent dehydrogenase (short-subunit alcohol dehydrogenase family)
VRTALVTGANSGIGLETAMVLGAAGYHVVAGARDPSRAEGLRARAVAAGLAIDVVPLDVTDDASVHAAVAATGPVDVLVNNAGTTAAAAVERTPDTVVRRVFETNFFGPLRLIRAVLPTMRARRQGAVVLVGSLSGRVPAPASGVYAASKQAAAVLSDALAIEAEPWGVRVSCVEIGPYRTNIAANAHVSGPGESAYEDLERRVGARARRRMREAGEASEVAHAILHLAESDQPPLRLPVGRHAREELVGDDRAERFRKRLRTELAREGVEAPGGWS